MNTPCSGSIIEVKSQASDMGRQNETRPPHDMKPATHPFGSVLLRLELALAMICAGRRRACPIEVEGRIGFNWLNHRSSIGIRDQSHPSNPRKACSAKEKISIFIRSLAQFEANAAVIPSIVAGSLDCARDDQSVFARARPRARNRSYPETI